VLHIGEREAVVLDKLALRRPSYGNLTPPFRGERGQIVADDVGRHRRGRDEDHPEAIPLLEGLENHVGELREDVMQGEHGAGRRCRYGGREVLQVLVVDIFGRTECQRCPWYTEMVVLARRVRAQRWMTMVLLAGPSAPSASV